MCKESVGAHVLISGKNYVFLVPMCSYHNLHYARGGFCMPLKADAHIAAIYNIEG
jgi:hypothetical protein